MPETEPPPGVTPPLPEPPARRRNLAASLGLPGIKLGMISALLLALLLPQCMVSDLIEEREGRQAEARQEIGAAWGQPQTVLAPLLVLPYRVRNLRLPEGWERGEVALPPADLRVRAALEPQQRRRGMFEAVVYTAHLDLAARFAASAVLPEGAEALWAEAYLATAASDPRPTTDLPALRWNGRDLVPEANSARCGNMEALRWPLRLDGPLDASRPVEVTGQMALRGTTTLSVVPIATRAHVTVDGDWQTPSYIGSDLPQQAPPQERGFHAEWFLGRAGGAMPLTSPGCSYEISGGRSVGVALLEAVPTYRMVTRAAKYAMMFLVLTFLTYLLFELVAGLRIHIAQYGLLGLSVVMFPLLLLAIAEPAGFAAAYAASAALVMAQAGLYTASVTRDRRLSLIFAGVLAALFGYLYVVLSMENFALLVGAATLFAALSAVMIVTRRLRWGG